ncbi:two-component system regulatory protein YycI [Bacillus sp. 31A1R]|uniref:Two-component system regulatory protein YycI n=1 Tax=Robertmurraya mangrovi TaxID=3098077 RepID=A0ABU5IWY9_9BACI|nr:two-component system regulatory protein YycI [Bacillus sp. 31A1R]MDZ5471679.1 two-component system regulatory protein YycI [Bacillus sp. 31A1R]
MDWSKIKTIFILSFLILNIYLINEFLKIRNSNQHDYIIKSSLENRLKVDEIEYVEPPKEAVRGKYLSATPKVFTVEELKKETKLAGQKVILKENNALLESVLKEPIKMGEKFDPTMLTAFMKNNILYHEQYRFWSKSDTTITFYQQLNNKVLYNNIYGELTFFLNDKNEIFSYKQTILIDIEELSEEEKILQPMKALETLYENGDIKFGSKITNIELGYFTYVHLASSQVLTPVWRFVINDEVNLFVNAFEGQILQLNTEERKWSE